MKVRILQLTHHADYGQLNEKEVLEVPDELGEHWVNLGIADETRAQLTRETARATQVPGATVSQEDAAQRVADQDLVIAEAHGDVEAARTRDRQAAAQPTPEQTGNAPEAETTGQSARRTLSR